MEEETDTPFHEGGGKHAGLLGRRCMYQAGYKKVYPPGQAQQGRCIRPWKRRWTLWAKYEEADKFG